MSLAITTTQLFAPTTLTSAGATLLTVPASPSTNTLTNGRVRATNIASSGSVAVTMYALQSGGTVSGTPPFANAETIGANAHIDLDVPQIPAGGTLVALTPSGSTSVAVFALAGVIIAQ